MKFLHEDEATWITFTKIRAKKNADDKRIAKMEFALQLDGVNTKKMPAFVADAWASMRNVNSAIVLEKIDRAIESQNLFFHAHPDDKAVRHEMEEVDLFDLRLEKDRDKKIWLFFHVVQYVDVELWKWIGAHFGREIAARFEECQGELKLAKAAGD